VAEIVGHRKNSVIYKPNLSHEKGHKARRRDLFVPNLEGCGF